MEPFDCCVQVDVNRRDKDPSTSIPAHHGATSKNSCDVFQRHQKRDQRRNNTVAEKKRKKNETSVQYTKHVTFRPPVSKKNILCCLPLYAGMMDALFRTGILQSKRCSFHLPLDKLQHLRFSAMNAAKSTGECCCNCSEHPTALVLEHPTSEDTLRVWDKCDAPTTSRLARRRPSPFPSGQIMNVVLQCLLLLEGLALNGDG